MSSFIDVLTRMFKKEKNIYIYQKLSNLHEISRLMAGVHTVEKVRST